MIQSTSNHIYDYSLAPAPTTSAASCCLPAFQDLRWVPVNITWPVSALIAYSISDGPRRRTIVRLDEATERASHDKRPTSHRIFARVVVHLNIVHLSRSLVPLRILVSSPRPSAWGVCSSV